jgi:hypothetical protein
MLSEHPGLLNERHSYDRRVRSDKYYTLNFRQNSL